jgi:hypothetical protein
MLILKPPYFSTIRQDGFAASSANTYLSSIRAILLRFESRNIDSRCTRRHNKSSLSYSYLHSRTLSHTSLSSYLSRHRRHTATHTPVAKPHPCTQSFPNIPQAFQNLTRADHITSLHNDTSPHILKRIPRASPEVFCCVRGLPDPCICACRIKR